MHKCCAPGILQQVNKKACPARVPLPLTNSHDAPARPVPTPVCPSSRAGKRSPDSRMFPDAPGPAAPAQFPSGGDPSAPHRQPLHTGPHAGLGGRRDGRPPPGLQGWVGGAGGEAPGAALTSSGRLGAAAAIGLGERGAALGAPVSDPVSPRWRRRPHPRVCAAETRPPAPSRFPQAALGPRPQACDAMKGSNGSVRCQVTDTEEAGSPALARSADRKCLVPSRHWLIVSSSRAQSPGKCSSQSPGYPKGTCSA